MLRLFIKSLAFRQKLGLLGGDVELVGVDDDPPGPNSLRILTANWMILFSSNVEVGEGLDDKVEQEKFPEHRYGHR